MACVCLLLSVLFLHAILTHAAEVAGSAEGATVVTKDEVPVLEAKVPESDASEGGTAAVDESAVDGVRGEEASSGKGSEKTHGRSEAAAKGGAGASVNGAAHLGEQVAEDDETGASPEDEEEYGTYDYDNEPLPECLQDKTRELTDYVRDHMRSKLNSEKLLQEGDGCQYTDMIQVTIGTQEVQKHIKDGKKNSINFRATAEVRRVGTVVVMECIFNHTAIDNAAFLQECAQCLNRNLDDISTPDNRTYVGCYHGGDGGISGCSFGRYLFHNLEEWGVLDLYGLYKLQKRTEVEP